MRKFNAKNLRREVQKQLKELRGGVGEQASLATINGERLTMNDEGLTINGEEKSFNFNLSSFNSSKRPSLPDLEQFVRRDYDLRYNVLTEQTEYRRKDEPQGEYRPVTQRVYRTWLTDLQREGMEFWKIDGLRTAIESMHIADIIR